MMNEILQLLDTVITELQQRRDFTSITFAVNQKPITAPQAVAAFTTYKQEVLTLQSRGTAIAEAKSDELLALISAIINSNLVISKMGQLNTKRTIEPGKAISYNKTLTDLQNQIMLFKASGETNEPDQYNPGTSISWD
ncbi:MAG: hypothetical protein ABID63_02355 [Pseudomonadota bacterium]